MRKLEKDGQDAGAVPGFDAIRGGPKPIGRAHMAGVIRVGKHEYGKEFGGRILSQMEQD